MLLTIVLIFFAFVALAALEIRLFWQVGERDDRRSGRKQSNGCRDELPSRPAARRLSEAATLRSPVISVIRLASPGHPANCSEPDDAPTPAEFANAITTGLTRSRHSIADRARRR